MSVPRTQLIGKKVYRPDGSLVGEVADTGFVLGSGNSTLIVKTGQDAAIELPWEEVAAAKDILILAKNADPSKAKQIEVAQPSTVSGGPAPERTGISSLVGRFKVKGGSQAPVCPTCGKPAKWIKAYSRWYCYQDKKYL